jgi:hypothetical protein
MFSKSPQNTEKYYWTEHAKYKMQFYGLSAQKILGVMRRPRRKEEGIVKNTIAVMQPVSSKIINGKTIWKQEAWVMFQKVKSSNCKVKSLGINKNKIKIISAWRYPGVSPKNNPIPDEILDDLRGYLD